ncbi:MAG: hypothetical protein AAGG07_01215 [Planctomycetota bacterium]
MAAHKRLTYTAEDAFALLERHESSLRNLPGVSGIGIAERSGRMSLVITVASADVVAKLPSFGTVESLPVVVDVERPAAAH